MAAAAVLILGSEVMTIAFVVVRYQVGSMAGGEGEGGGDNKQLCAAGEAGEIRG